MLVCNSIDTICLTINLDRETQAYLLNWQFCHHLMPKNVFPTDCGIPRYKWGVQIDGIRIYYSDSEAMNPNCFIKFSSEYIQRVGYSVAYARCVTFLKTVGMSRPGRKLKLSQIDLAFDFQSDLGRYLDNPAYRISTRLGESTDRKRHDVVKWRLWGIGASNGYKVRVYDKLLESNEVAGKQYWHAVWQGQGFELDRPIWRLEYEMHRDFLKNWKINRLTQFLNAQQSIQKRLFELWSIKVLDDSNISRCSYVPEFKYLFEHFSQDFIEHKVDRRPETYLAAANQQLSRAVNALVSMMTNNAAAMYSSSKEATDIVVCMSKCFRIFQEKLNETILGSPESFLSAVTVLLQKKGFYFAPANTMSEEMA